MDSLFKKLVPNYTSRGQAAVPPPKLEAPPTVAAPAPEVLPDATRAPHVNNTVIQDLPVQPLVSFLPTPIVLQSLATNYSANLETFRGFNSPYYIEVGGTGGVVG